MPLPNPTLVAKFKDHVVLPLAVYHDMAGVYHLYRAGFLVEAPAAIEQVRALKAALAEMHEATRPEQPAGASDTGPVDDSSDPGDQQAPIAGGRIPPGTVYEPLSPEDLADLERRGSEETP